MAYARRLLNPIQKSISYLPHIAPVARRSHHCLNNNLSLTVDCWSALNGMLTPLVSANRKRLLLRRPSQLGRRRSHSSGGAGAGTLVFASFLVGSTGFSQRLAYAMDNVLVATEDVLDPSNGKQDLPPFWVFLRKFWLPAFFLITLLNWDQPFIMVSKVVLFLITTKPSPLSVYIFVEKLCQQFMRQQPSMYFLKSLYATRVEVQDYKLLCLAAVEVKGQKLTLLGVLGGWWVLPFSRESLTTLLLSVLY